MWREATLSDFRGTRLRTLQGSLFRAKFRSVHPPASDPSRVNWALLGAGPSKMEPNSLSTEVSEGGPGFRRGQTNPSARTRKRPGPG